MSVSITLKKSIKLNHVRLIFNVTIKEINLFFLFYNLLFNFTYIFKNGLVKSKPNQTFIYQIKEEIEKNCQSIPLRKEENNQFLTYWIWIHLKINRYKLKDMKLKPKQDGPFKFYKRTRTMFVRSL